ncbi:MAG: GtrA family protein [Anaerolineales bacterium]|nr:GtrA family protein [Anaerolineales bacterium]
MSIIRNEKERQRFVRFAIVGSLGAVVDFGFFNILAHVIHLRAVLASICSFSLAVINNFTWNRFWTYPDSRSKPLGYQLVLFALINIVGLAIRTPLFVFLEGRLVRFFNQLEIFRLFPLRPIWVAHNLSLAAAILVVMFWNYYINRYLTYNDVTA